MAKLSVWSGPPVVDEVLLVLLVALVVLLVELLVLPEHDSPQIEVTWLTHIASHMVLQQ
jgi:hypothetical protein